MWNTITHYNLAGRRMVQFNGKWPFYRFMGMQEPASVLFSLLNMFAFHGMLIQLWNSPSRLNHKICLHPKGKKNLRWAT